VKHAAFAVASLLLLGATTAEQYHIDLTRYFSSPSGEAQSRAATSDEARVFAVSATPSSPRGLLRWLQRYDDLLESLERHDVYVYLMSEENDSDTADLRADETLGALEDAITDRVVRAAQELGASRIASWTRVAPLQAYRYLLEDLLVRGSHRLSSADARAVALTATPVLDLAASSYKALRKASAPIAMHQDAYAALLVSIGAARNGVARLRGFAGAAEAAYFDRSLSPESVERTLKAIHASTAYARYRKISALAPKAGFTPAPTLIGPAIVAILAAERPMGVAYESAYADLLNPLSGRLELCTAPSCDDDGFSVGFAGIDSGVYYGGYTGTINAVRALAHEAGHAVHREFMSRHQPIAAYNRGPSFMFESFAIFNELLFLNHLYETAANDEQRAYFLNYFLDDATFQVFGSAEETELERAIYSGIDDRTLKVATDFDALTATVFARYDPSTTKDPATALYWARDRLFFTDPLYDVNYLYAGLLALNYFVDFQRDGPAFSHRYVALLENGFNDTPAALERRFLGIDLSNEAGLVATSGQLIDARTALLAELYAKAAQTP